MANSADFEFSLVWNSRIARHTERLFLPALNPQVDRFPAELASRFQRAPAGDWVGHVFAPGELVPVRGDTDVREFQVKWLPTSFRGQSLDWCAGRFYPRALLARFDAISEQDFRPFRVLEVERGRLLADFSHPLAGRELLLEGRILAAAADRLAPPDGGRDVAAQVTQNGPGMQASLENHREAPLADADFARVDEQPDADFYAQPRLVYHVDTTAAANVAALYGRLLASGMRVLDLMSSWDSHVPEHLDLEVIGLGMNAAELERNARLSQRLVQDLNAQPGLAFPRAAFDAVICALSVEYLTHPQAVFAEVARVLRPGGLFINLVSERWFPPKVIDLWTRLHPFERQGLVLRYYRDCGRFTDLQTESVRGLPRPPDDRYADRLAHSDPVYGVWGTLAG